jgi:Family of unknown function (DUF6491)
MTAHMFRLPGWLSATILLALGVGSTALAASEANQANTEAPYSAYEKLDHLPALKRLHSWSVVNDKAVVIWATAYDPYLVVLARPVPAHGLKFAHVIGVTSSVGKVSARFDWLRVDGITYPIDSIYKLTREQANELTDSP